MLIQYEKTTHKESKTSWLRNVSVTLNREMTETVFSSFIIPHVAILCTDTHHIL